MEYPHESGKVMHYARIVKIPPIPSEAIPENAFAGAEKTALTTPEITKYTKVAITAAPHRLDNEALD